MPGYYYYYYYYYSITGSYEYFFRLWANVTTEGLCDIFRTVVPADCSNTAHDTQSLFSAELSS